MLFYPHFIDRSEAQTEYYLKIVKKKQCTGSSPSADKDLMLTELGLLLASCLSLITAFICHPCSKLSDCPELISPVMLQQLHIKPTVNYY